VRFEAGIRATQGVSDLGDFRDRERRVNPRTYTSFTVTVRGVDAYGERLDVHTTLDNVSGGGMYVRLPTRVERGDLLALGIRFSETGSSGRAARVAARGVVLRVDAAPDGAFGVAIAFTKTRVF
jgi:hypothetical protein